MEFNTINCNKFSSNKNKKEQKGFTSGNPIQKKEYYGCGKKNYF